MYNINSVFIKFFYFNLKQFVFKQNKNTFFNIFFKTKINFFCLAPQYSFKKYYFFFDYFLKVNKYFFIKCLNLLLHNYLFRYINIIYSLTQININFFFLSNQSYFNFFWNVDINFFLKNFTKNNFSRFLINFFRKHKIKLLIFFDSKFLIFLPFFKRVGFITSGFLTPTNNLNFLDLPLFFNNFSIFSKYFFFNLTYKVYLLSLFYKYINTFYKYLYNYNKIIKLINV